jgi:tetratricopeptide (TPR) repeat protein
MDFAAKGDAEKALLSYLKAEFFDPFDYRSFVNKGNIYYKNQDYANALASYATADDLYPYSSNIATSLAIVYARLGDADKSEFYFMRSVKYGPLFVGAYYNYALFLYGRGEYEQAAGLFEKAIMLSPYDQELYVNALKSYIRIGDQEHARLLAEAIKAQKKAIFPPE